MDALLLRACYRATSDRWPLPGALVLLLTAPAALRRYDVADPLASLIVDVARTLGQPAASLAGGLRAVWDYPGWVDRLSAALTAGHYLNTVTLVATMPTGVHAALPAAVRDALGAVIAGRVLSLVDVVAAEMGVTAPATVTVAAVASALASATPPATP